MVDRDSYDTYMQRKTTMEVEKEKHPKRITARIEKFLKVLAGLGIRWTTLGCVSESSQLPKGLNVFHYTAYAVTGNGKEPELFSCFLKLLVNSKAFEKLLKLICLKIRKKLNAVKKQLRSERAKNKIKNGQSKISPEKEEESGPSTDTSRDDSVEKSNG